MSKKALEKVLYILLLMPIVIIVSVWVYTIHFEKIDTAEVDRYYDLLLSVEENNYSPLLVLDLGMRQGDGLNVAADRIKWVMGLEKYKILIATMPEKYPPAKVKDLGNGLVGMYISEKVKEPRELLNILTHELGHVYVWGLDPVLFGNCDKEKLVDCSGIFLGLGILMLNGQTNDYSSMPGGWHSANKRTYGYITPEQMGYLLARYAKENKIAIDNIKPFLSSAGKRYFDTGYAYLSRKEKGKKEGNAFGACWCSSCGAFTKIPLSVKNNEIKCAKCSRVFP